MSLSDKIRYAELLAAKKRKRDYNKIMSYYPEKGPLRRELYPKHLKFFELGATKEERLALAANRIGKCVSGDTLIESPDGDSRRVDEIKGPHYVWAWDGEKKVRALAEEPFKKPKEMIYRVWLQSGQYIDCAAEHRFLSESGWLFLSDLFGYVPCLPESSSEYDRAKSLEDVLRLMNTAQGYQDDYHQECHLGDEQLQKASNSVQFSFPWPSGALQRIQTWYSLGARACTNKHIPLQASGHPSIPYASGHASGLFFEFLSRTACISDRWCRGLRQKYWQPLCGFLNQLQLAFSENPYPKASVPAFITPDGLSDTVICYQPIGVQHVWDFHVPGYKNYCARGFINHNTEGMGAYEMTLHLTGDYPKWWKGRRFESRVHAWAAGDTSQTVREIIQDKLLGPINDMGSGMIPKDKIARVTKKRGIADGIETIFVKHKSGEMSELTLKSYDQKREAFQGTKKDVIWLDEEPPLDIYTECLLRTADTAGGEENGIIMLTFTPLMGMSETVLAFLPNGEIDQTVEGSKAVVMATWDDVPHLSESAKKKLWDSIPPFQRDARSKGIPQLGAGAIYPVPESDILVDDFEIPNHWPRGYAMDVGWNRTAAGFYAWDRENDIVYRIGEHYRGEAEPSVHAEAIKARGKWLQGVIDPASRGRSQADGVQLMKIYRDLGLNIDKANNAVEAGIYEAWQRMSTGRFKVFKSCQNWIYEFRLYRRDEKGRIVKENDHAMDEMRYFIMSGISRATINPEFEKPEPEEDYGYSGAGWTG